MIGAPKRDVLIQSGCDCTGNGWDVDPPRYTVRDRKRRAVAELEQDAGGWRVTWQLDRPGVARLVADALALLSV